MHFVYACSMQMQSNKNEKCTSPDDIEGNSLALFSYLIDSRP